MALSKHLRSVGAMTLLLAASDAPAILPVALTPGIPVPRCPRHAITDQRLHGSVPGWQEERRHVGDGYALIGIGFSQAPDPGARRANARIEAAETAPSRRLRGLQWTFTGKRLPIQILCDYAVTSVVLSQPMPAGVRECTIRGVEGSDAALDFDTLVCH